MKTPYPSQKEYNELVAKKLRGFALLELLIILAVVAALGVVGFKIFHTKHKPAQVGKTTKTQSDNPLLLKSIGFNLDNYDPATNRAGDMVFTHEDHDLGITHMIFADFGVQDVRSPNDPTKRNPQPTFVLPLGTKVHSLVDGVVVNVQTLYSSDYTIWVSSHEGSSYIYETEHVDNPIVKKGDHVTGGQVIGEVSDHDSQYHPGFGIVEIGILNPQPDGKAQHICPFHYLEPSIKADIQKKILNVHQAWMQYIGMPNLYDDAHSVEPGCFTLDPVNG